MALHWNLISSFLTVKAKNIYLYVGGFQFYHLLWAFLVLHLLHHVDGPEQNNPNESVGQQLIRNNQQIIKHLMILSSCHHHLAQTGTCSVQLGLISHDTPVMNIISSTIIMFVPASDVCLEAGTSWFSRLASFVDYILDLLPPAQVHLAMVRYHEAGRFCEKDEQWDQDSAMFHLERAALCGELEAIVALGQCCLQLPHHILPEMELEVPCNLFSSFSSAVLTLCLLACFQTFLCCWQDNAGNRMKGFKYLLLAAESGDRSSMIIVARAFDTGINLSADRSVKVWKDGLVFWSLKSVDKDIPSKRNSGPTVMITLPPRGISWGFY